MVTVGRSPGGGAGSALICLSDCIHMLTDIKRLLALSGGNL